MADSLMSSAPHRRPAVPRWAALVATAALGVLAACAPAPARRPSPELPRPTPEDPAPAELPRSTAVAFAFGPGSNRYTVQSITEVSVSGDSVPPGVDTVRVGGTVLLAISGGDSVRSVAGTVYETSLESGALIRQPGPFPRRLPPASLSFEGMVTPGRVELSLADGTTASGAAATGDSTGCPPTDAIEATLLGLVRETLPVVPRTMSIGATWRDSVTMVTCRTGVMITANSQHDYEVLELRREQGIHTARLRRQTVQHVTGSGEQSGLPVSITGEGSGESELWLDLTNGRLMSQSGRSTVVMKHLAGNRTAIVEQSTTLTTRLDGQS